MSTTENFDTTGRSVGVGTFAEGTVTKHNDQYHVSGSSQRGVRYRCFVDTVFVGYDETVTIENGEERDVTDKQFRLGDGELHLR